MSNEQGIANCTRCGKEVKPQYFCPDCDVPKQSIPEPEGMDDVFSKICELISIGQKGEAKKILKQAVSRSEGWATDEDVLNFTKMWSNYFPVFLRKQLEDYKLKKGK